MLEEITTTTYTWYVKYGSGATSPEEPFYELRLPRYMDIQDLANFYPADPRRDGYTFVGWNDPQKAGNGSIVILGRLIRN